MESIKFSNGEIITNLEERIREYCRVEIYFGYDDQHDVNNIITLQNIKAANRLFARIGQEVKDRIIGSQIIEDLLVPIENIELGSLNDYSWREYKEKIRCLLKEFCSIKGVGLAVATKILHIKRPRLIPILDAFVVKFLNDTDLQFINDKRELADIGIRVIDLIRHDINSNWEVFEIIQSKLSDLPIKLEKVRLNDILIWSIEKWDVRRNLNAPYGKPMILENNNLRGVIKTSASKSNEFEIKDAIPPHYREILTLDEFRNIRRKGVGIIVITDIANPTRMHRTICERLKEENFITKVLKNKCRNGHYYWMDSIEFARKNWDAKFCTDCI